MNTRLITILLIAFVLLGAAAGTAIVVRQPAFWLDLGVEVVTRAKPEVMRWLYGRMPPEEEKQWRECQRKAGRWNFRTNKCE